MERLVCDAVSDHHVHCNYSFDAEGSIDQYCQRAMRIGLLEICFTSHYDADPERIDHEGYMVINGQREPLSDDAIKAYLDDLKRAYREYGPAGVMVKSGLEFGYFDGCEKPISELLARFPLDYRLGAVHSIDGYCICCKDDAQKVFAKYTLEQLADKYFATLDKCAATGLFHCLAHIDIYRRYGLEYYGDEVMTIHRGRIEKVFETMRKNHVGYELNTSAIRHGLAEYYPCMDIVNLARETSTPMVAIGSDAHRPDQLALDFDPASAVAYELIPYTDEG
jgi:histidinol-phosphatase (PHP family)